MNDLSANQIDALLEALRDAATADTGPENALTSEEIAEATGIEIRKLRVILKQLWKAGKVRDVRVRRPGLGRLASVTAYELVA